MYNLKNFSFKKFGKSLFGKISDNTVCVTNESVFTLQVQILTGSYLLTLEECTTDELYYQIGELVRLRSLQTSRFYAFYGHKPLLRGRLLSDYNIPQFAHIHVEFPNLLGGSKSHIVLPTYHIVPECEKMVLMQDVESKIKNMEISERVMRLMSRTLQGSETYDIGMNVMLNHWEKFLNERSPTIKKWLENNPINGGIENIILITHFYQKCETFNEFVLLMRLGYKLITGKVLYNELFKYFLGSSQENILQADFAQNVAFMRKAFDGVNDISDCKMIQKLSKMYAFLVAQGFLKGVGMSISEKEFSMFDKVYKKRDLTQFNMVKHAIDLAIFICEKLIIYRETGDMSCMIHDVSTYSVWFAEAEKLLALAPFTGNLVPHGTTYFTYLSELRNAIEKGEAIARFASKNNGAESILIQRKLSSLRLIQNNETSKKSASKERRAPFGVLVHGASSVAKSSFTKMLFYYYGSLHGLQKDDQYRYVRSPADEYWTNFDSSKWCIQLDDVAFLLPTATSEVDPTLKELLNVVNNVPYVPPQAALEDKGRTPVLARLCVATSNASDLNAHEYFHCPLAVRRRLPYIINVKPKGEYLHPNGKFIDPTKIPAEHNGFPDLWIITVQKLVPITHCTRDWAILEDVAVFTDVHEFLRHFGEASMQHENNQDKSMGCDSYMKDLTVCNMCMNVSHNCSCSLQAGDTSTIVIEYLAHYMVACLIWLYQFTIVKKCVHPMIERSTTRYIISKLFVPLLSDEQQIVALGWMNSVKREWKKHKDTIIVISAIGLLLTSFIQLSNFSRKDDEKASKQNSETLKSDDEESLQGNMYGTVETQLAKEERQNVWYNSHIETTNFDIPIASRSLVGINTHELREQFARNCVRLDFKSMSGVYSCRTGGVMLGGQLCLFNRHVLKDYKLFTVTVIHTDPSKGFTSNISFTIDVADLGHDPSNDLCIMSVKSLPPFKDIRKYWMSENIAIDRVCMLKRNNDASVRVLDVHGTSVREDFPIEALGIKVKMLMGMASEPTQYGDCGSLAIAMTPRGPVLCGIHTVGYNNTFGVPLVDNNIIAKLVETQKMRFVVQAGAAPEALQECGRKLVPIHHKSIFRYIENGQAYVYGALTGHNAKPKSKVTLTPLYQEMCNHFNTSVQHGKPAMDGWEPWYNNVKEMVRPRVTYNRAILEKCVEQFTMDIISQLPQDWEKELCFLSDRAAVNGLPGVKYIDRMNMTSSMGFPWNTTKKSFIVPDISDDYPEGVDFTPEVWTKVRAIEERYNNGECAYPIFMGHLKDEATPLKKCAIKKTRLFTGGPVDWSIVVRKKLLTFVRLVQKNIFVFEAAPGVTVQSTQWGEIYDYLTQHGADRIIAGDYGKFDKHMISDFILAAFEVICNIYTKAGFPVEEVRSIMCIGYDIAFPVVNVKGDLVQFFGTNPSGHPLTVIVNSLVNSLYMRYAYGMLNNHNVSDFRHNVNLLTYGDDNCMGVSERAWWFTHTNIQRIMNLIGVEYTMADKEAESVPYIHIKDCSFLKRTWRYDEDVGAYLAPLEEASIHRSLTVWVPSGTLDCHHQMVQVIIAANNEYFFYGKKIFSQHHEFFKQVLNQEPYCRYKTDQTLPTWGELYERFWRASGKEPPVLHTV